MAITNPTSVLSGFNVGSLGTYDTAVATLTAGRWYTLVWHGYRSPTPNTGITSVTHDPLGTPLAFSLIAGATVVWDAGPLRRMEVWHVRPTSTTASALIRIVCQTQSAAGWSLIEWSAGVDPTTFAVQVVTATGSGGTASALTMAAYAHADNATFFVTAVGTGSTAPAESLVPGESRTELTEVTETERANHHTSYQNPHGGDVTLNSSWSGAEDWAAIGIEVKALAQRSLPYRPAPLHALIGR